VVVVARPAERVLSRLLTGGVGLLACAVLATGGIAVLDQRADEAAVREGLAVRDFRERVRPIAEAVFDHVQPLAEAERQAEEDASGGFSVYVDVARDPAVGAAVREQQAALDDLRVPGSLQGTAELLRLALDRFRTAAERYADLPFEVTTGDVDLPGATRAAAGALRDGLDTWSAAIAGLYPQQPPAVPVPPGDEAEPVRRPLSHPAYLLEAGRVCGSADATGEGEQVEPTDEASDRRAAAQEAAVLRELVRRLLAVPVPEQDRARLERDVLVPLREYGRVADVLERIAGTGATPEVLFRELVVADEAGARVALGLGDYGSRTCALFFGS
jgi:hypothetical protein